MSQTDPFTGNTPGLSTPANNTFSITPTDDVDVPVKARAIYVGVQGDLAIKDQGGTIVIFKGAQGFLPIRPLEVRATGTTATDIIGVY